MIHLMSAIRLYSNDEQYNNYLGRWVSSEWIKNNGHDFEIVLMKIGIKNGKRFVSFTMGDIYYFLDIKIVCQKEICQILDSKNKGICNFKKISNKEIKMISPPVLDLYGGSNGSNMKKIYFVKPNTNLILNNNIHSPTREYEDGPD